MGVSWGAMAGSFLAPFLYGLYWKKTTKAGCMVNFIFGAGFMIYNMLFRDTLPQFLQSPINAGAFTMLFGLILVPVVSSFSKKPCEEEIRKIFSCYELKNEVPVTQSLE
jgi:Na+(H+)/acetate symporter ActP